MALNVLLKSFEGAYEPEVIEHALKDFTIGTCVSITWTEDTKPRVTAEKHLWVSGKNQKAGNYDGMDWNTIPPLDEELIENMRECEAIFMNMITRFSPEDIPYAERKRQYFDHLRFWNDMLDTHKIDIMVSAHNPHQIFDIVIYYLCKLKGIPTLLLERCFLIDHFFMTPSWQESASELKPRIEELLKNGKPVQLSERMERYILKQSTTKKSPWFLHIAGDISHLRRKSFLRKWSGIAFSMLIKKPRRLLHFILRPSFWKRKIADHRTVKFYDNNAVEPDLQKPYVYFALQMEPEMSLCPMSGAYCDQIRTIQLLAWHLPKDVMIYIKEHPEQTEWFRSVQFYQDFLNIPSVRLIRRNFNSFTLMDHAKAVITGTGSAAMEALLRQIPPIMMGHRFYMYAPDAHRVHSAEDMQHAIESIFVKKERPSMERTRIFLKAVEELAGPTMIGTPQSEDMQFSKEEQAQMMGAHIAKRIRDVL